MKKRTHLIGILTILLLAALACTSESGTSPPARDPDILFQDNFSSPDSGWDQVRDDSGITDYDQNGYRFQILQPNYDFWSNPGLNVGDVRINVEAQKLGGPDDNNFGVICRYQASGNADQVNFYYFIISSDGYYGIGKFRNSVNTLIGMDVMQFSEHIHRGDGVSNNMRADCVGSALSLYANDTLLVQVQDTDFSAGDVGLLAGTFEEPGTDILFDNFVVRKP